ncbi:MAG TPA: helix-turn-helix transcriptional regulator [Lacipirellulaceae bacterium]
MDISLEDVSNVIRLVREVCDRWDDPRAWREHLLHGACNLLGGNVGTMVADAGPSKTSFGRPVVMSVVGLPPSLQALVPPAYSQFENRAYDDLMPGLSKLQRQIDSQGWVTAARDAITETDSYHASPLYQSFRRQIDCDDYVVSIRIVDVPRRVEGINIDRPHGAPPFGHREVELLKLLHDEIAPLIGVRLATEEHLCRDGLSKRLGETLSLLLDGRSEKEVASALGLSARTVHDYVTMLYEHFEVSSRAELLAYFIRRAPVSRGSKKVDQGTPSKSTARSTRKMPRPPRLVECQTL